MTASTGGRLPLYPGIDLLRALAAMLVLVYHVIRLGDWARLPEDQIPLAFRNGWVGVDLFLVISGFVITLTALSGVERQGLGFRSDFMKRRLARIFPLYALTTLVFLILVNPTLFLLPMTVWMGHLGVHLLFLHNLSHVTHGSINGPAWSVALEMQFYLAMLWIAPWLTRASIVRFVVIALVVGLAWRFATTVVLVPGTAAPIIQFIYLTQLPGVIDEFAMGMVLALVLHRGNGFLWRRLAVGWANCLGWVLVSACLLGVAAWLLESIEYWKSVPMIVGWRPLLATGFAAMVAAAITFPAAGSWVLAPLRYLGQISYGMYLWHMLVLLIIIRTLPMLAGTRLLLYVLETSFALAVVTWHLVEKPNLARYKGAPRESKA